MAIVPGALFSSAETHSRRGRLVPSSSGDLAQHLFFKLQEASILTGRGRQALRG